MIVLSFKKIITWRFGIFVILTLLMVDIYLAPVREYVSAMHEHISFCQLIFMISSNYFSKIFFLCVLYFYSNVPFMEEQEQYFFLRYGRKRFTIKNLVYIGISSVVITAVTWLCSFLCLAPVLSFARTWSSMDKSVALTDLGIELGMLYGISYDTLLAYTPHTLFLNATCLLILCVIFIGIFTYTMSLILGSKVSFFATTIVIILPDIMKNITSITTYFSPTSWVQVDSWRYGYDATLPDLPYIYVAYIYLIVVLAIIAILVMKRKEFVQ